MYKWSWHPEFPTRFAGSSCGVSSAANIHALWNIPLITTKKCEIVCVATQEIRKKPDPDDQDVVASVEGPLFLVIIISRSEASASKWFSFRVWQPSPGLFFHFLSTCMYVCVPGQQFVLRVLENNSTHCVASTVQVHHGKFVIPLYLMSLREKEACVEWCRISVELHLMGCGQEALVLHHQYCI